MNTRVQRTVADGRFQVSFTIAIKGRQKTEAGKWFVCSPGEEVVIAIFFKSFF